MYNLTYYYEIYIMNDTLLIGGGGTKGNILIGALKALLDKGLIKEDYSNITTYVTCSVGSIIAFLMCCFLYSSKPFLFFWGMCQEQSIIFILSRLSSSHFVVTNDILFFF